MVDVNARELTVQVARILAPVTVLGPGRRVGLWVQGCRIGCLGCSSRDTWDPEEGVPVGVGDLVDRLADALAADHITGLTITGGEPTEQADALGQVVRDLRRQFPGLDVLLFTGRTLAAARRLAPVLMGLADGVVAGPYRADLPLPGHRLLASANQRLVVSDRLAARYQEWLDEDAAVGMQVMVSRGGLYLVGMPDPGDLERFRAELSNRGVELKGVSW